MIEVQHPAADKAVVSIDQAPFFITKQESLPYIRYTVASPDGHTAVVQDIDGRLTTYDENSEWMHGIAIYAGNERILEEGNWLYSPSAIVRAAHPPYHEKQGGFLLFLGAVILFVYGWCGFRYQRFQDVLFYLTPSTWYANAPEPSDFYYFMCKVGGVLTMLAAGWLFILSL
ncbi:hypothetical protein DUZ99_03275 [Xylanibacillus composti]|nr:hypothetical protein [Xylanibacillus composti]